MTTLPSCAAEIITAMSEPAAFAAAPHRVAPKPGSPDGALRLLVEDAITAAFGRVVLTTDRPPSTGGASAGGG